MLNYLTDKKISILIVEKTDRLTRNHKDAVVVNEWVEKDEIRQVHFVKENFVLHKNSKSNDKFIWNVKVSVAQYYIDNLSEEVKKGQKEKLSQGWLPTRPPLGYKTVGEKGHRIHVVDDKTKYFAEMMFNLYSSGLYSIKELTERLYKEGLRSTGGKRVPHSRIHRYLREPFYIGYNRWNNKDYKGNQETFISKDTFDRVQNLLDGNRTPKYGKHNYLFKGLIRCSECGGTITWEKQKGTLYGHCNHYRDCSQSKWAKENEVESQLIDIFDTLQIKNERLMNWIKKALKESHKDEIDHYKRSTDELNKRGRMIKNRLSSLYDDKLDGKISEEFYKMKLEEYTSEREETEKLKANYNNADTNYYEKVSTLYDISQNAKERYEKADAEQKRKLLKLIFNKMWLDDGVLSYEHAEPYKILSKAVFDTNSSKEVKNEKSLNSFFELAENVGTAILKKGNEPEYPNWLPRVDVGPHSSASFWSTKRATPAKARFDHLEKVKRLATTVGDIQPFGSPYRTLSEVYWMF